VFVHGFTGHPKNTWTWQAKKHDRDEEPSTRRFKIPKLSFGQSPGNPSTAAPSTPQHNRTETTEAANSGNVTEPEERRKEIYWPVDLASETIPNSRILTYSYDTNIRYWLKGPVSKKTVHDHAWDLLCALEALRRDASARDQPLLFVAHSLGGIIVKQALRRSRDAASTKIHLHNIFEETVGVLFFGTPHKGADPRNLFHHILSATARALGVQVSKTIVDTLMTNSIPLRDLEDEFSVMAHDRKWQIYSFQEEYGIRELLGTQVVDDLSSCLGDPMIETKLYISSNHMDMCRFSGLQDPEYLKVAAAMTFILGTESVVDAISNEQPLSRGPSPAASLNEVSQGLFIVDEQLRDASPPEAQSGTEVGL
jgi:hypothetical protein